jgi:predicted RNA-binding protein Jag
MSSNCNNNNCAQIRSFLKEYIDLMDDPTIIENDDEWSDRLEEILSELRILLSTN